MIVGKFGDKTFDVSPSKINVPKDLSISGELDTSTEDANGKKPTTTIKGMGLIKISAELRLLATAGVDVQGEIDTWSALRNAETPYPFLLCGRAISLNKFLLKSCEASDYVIVPIAGSPRVAAATLKLDFEEYLPPGAQKSGVGTAKKKISAGLLKVETPPAYREPTAGEKAAAKRINPGMA